MALTIESIYIRRMLSLQVKALCENYNLLAFFAIFLLAVRKETAINVVINAGGAGRLLVYFQYLSRFGAISQLGLKGVIRIHVIVAG